MALTCDVPQRVMGVGIDGQDVNEALQEGTNRLRRACVHGLGQAIYIVDGSLQRVEVGGQV